MVTTELKLDVVAVVVVGPPRATCALVVDMDTAVDVVALDALPAALAATAAHTPFQQQG